MSSNTLEHLQSELIQGEELLAQDLKLNCGLCVIQIKSNSSHLLEELHQYFSHFLLTEPVTKIDITVIAIESEILETAYPFKDWPREAGKSSRKDAYYELATARLILKVRTGMLFLQSAMYKIAAGPCLTNPNQVVNFINSQHMNWLQQRGWLICHAAAITYAGQAYALAGFSGGGKSTLMLHLLDDDRVNYISNDRTFVRSQDGVIRIVGIAKLPRINPGTIVHNPRLQALVPEQEREQLLNLPRQQLWELEDKYDVDIEAVYGSGRIDDNKPLQAFIVLNWQHDSDQRFQVKQVDIAQRRDLLAAIMKSPGPFYQDLKGVFLSGNAELNMQAYLSALSGIKVYEASGKVDFPALQAYFVQHIFIEAEA